MNATHCESFVANVVPYDLISVTVPVLPVFHELKPVPSARFSSPCSPPRSQTDPHQRQMF